MVVCDFEEGYWECSLDWNDSERLLAERWAVVKQQHVLVI